MITMILIFVAGIFNGICDTLASVPQFNKSVFASFKDQQYWNFGISWSNKYKGDDPELGPKFIGSTTFLVFLTDGWHFFKAGFVFLFISAAFFYQPCFNVSYLDFHYVDFIICNIAFGLGWQGIQLIIINK